MKTDNVDLHTHSTASDGTLGPRDLVQAAKKKGLVTLALTDHDTVAGLADASAEAGQLGLRFIPGIEVSVAWTPGEFHLLGLGLKDLNEHFIQTLGDLANSREERNYEIIKRMQEMGIAVAYEDIKAIAGGTSVGRPHFAAFMVQQKLAKNPQQAFERYLAKGRSLYAPRRDLSFQSALALIKSAGGKAVLAHPLSLYVAWGKLPELIGDFKAQGLDGLEAWHPSAKVGECKRLEKLAASLGLVITGGSDFHGENRPDRKLGKTAGGLSISVDLDFLS